MQNETRLEQDELLPKVIKCINEDGTDFNNFLLMNRIVMDESIEKLSTDKHALIAPDDLKPILHVSAVANAAEEAIDDYRDMLKQSDDYLESVKINATCICNALKEISKYLKRNMLNVPTPDLLMYITGGLEKEQFIQFEEF